MADDAHVWTDEQIAALERRIFRTYADAAEELKKTIEDYFEKLKARDAKQRAKLEAGEITEEEYKLWRVAQIGRGERFEALRDRIAERYTSANETTVAYVNDQTPSIYSLNRNFTAYTIEQVHGNVGFNLWDESTVRRLIVEQPNLMPYYPEKLAVKRGIDLDWGKKQITASITSSILQGKNLRRMADDLQARMQTMNRDSAIRTARTAYTTAQNAGRQDAFVAAEKMGIKVRKRWIATKDNRTRHDHGAADGQTVGADEPFTVGGYPMMFPGDAAHGAPGRLIYNCFIGETQIAADSKVIRSYRHKYSGPLVKVKTSGGVDFTCTPNHPILTPFGWVAAARLHDGDNLVVTFNGNGIGFRRYGDIQHIHSRMKALYNSFHRLGMMSRDTTLGVNFHGDIPATDVEVITKKRVLRNYGNPGIGDRVNKFLLKDSDESLMCKSTFVKHFRSIGKAALCFIRRKCKTFTFFRRGLRHPVIHGFRSPADVNIVLPQYAIDDLPAETVNRRELLDRLSGNVFLDKIVSVEIVSSECHVFNLQTESGYYFANTIIPQNLEMCNGIYAIAKNCRCTMRTVEKEGIEQETRKMRVRDPETGETKLIDEMTYAEWAGWKKSVAQSANSGIIDVVEKATGAKQGTPLSMLDAATGANPGYAMNSSYRINCQRCVQTYEMRRRGYDVIAKPKPASGNTVRWGSECFIQPGEDALKAFSMGRTAASVKKEISTAPDGARYAVYVKWKGKNTSAHVFIAEKDSSGVRYLDPQTGKDDVEYYFSLGRNGTFGIFRFDDKNMTSDETIIAETMEVL